MAVGDNECVPLYEPGERITAQVTAAVVGKTFVDISGDFTSGPLLSATSEGSNIKVATCVAANKAIGVAAYDQPNVGGKVHVITGPGMVIPVTVGAAITFGQEVQANATGQAIPLAAGKAQGKAVSGASSGDVFVKLY